MKQEKTQSVITVRLPDELLEKARQVSNETGVSISFVVRKAIETWVNAEFSKISKAE